MQSLNSEEQVNKGFWKDCPKLKTPLIVIIPSTLLLIIILLAVFIRSEKGFCKTDSCTQRINQLKRGMNLDINPCDDFYQFVCGKVIHDTSRKNFYEEASEKLTRDLLKLYKEDIKDSEHKMVKFAKRLFQKCLHSEGQDNLKSLKDAIQEIGGRHINEDENTRFNWVEATYKLRELGYPFSMFIKVDVTRVVLADKEKYYLEITLADKLDENEFMSRYSKSEATAIMTRVARFFGVTNKGLAEYDAMRDVYEFWERFPSFVYTPYENHTIQQLQQRYDVYNRVPFNWLEYLSQVTGRKIAVSPTDYVSVQRPDDINDWINLVSTTPERTIGNYMIWKVIETQLPHLTKNILDIMKYSTNDTKEEFCLKEINKRFLPSPIEVINARNLLPLQKKQQVEKIFSEIKLEFQNLFEKNDWMDEKDKRIINETVKNVHLILGLPGDYFDDKLLDDMDVDLVEIESGSFLNYLAQANKNYQAMIFKQITLPFSNNTISRIYLKPERTVEPGENEFFVPINFSYYIQSDTPRYFQYSLVGRLFNELLSKSVFVHSSEFAFLKKRESQQTTSATERTFKCLKNQMQNYILSDDNMVVVHILTISADEMASYTAYEKWIQSNREETLPGSSYTSAQLFWIAGTYCHVLSPSITHPVLNDVNFYSNTSLVSKFNNKYFARDFNCSLGSKTNPTVKCPLLL